MKKYFIFAAIAAAGLFASCSSDESFALNDAPVTPSANDGDLVPIKLNVAQYGTVTRGTGTVGGIVNGDGDAVTNDGTVDPTAANEWQEQKVNVYMFKTFDTRSGVPLTMLKIAKFENPEGTLTNIFDDAELTTPKGAASGTASYLTGQTATQDVNGTAISPAEATRYVRYYPMADRFDFWGYRIDDAANKTLAWKKAAADPNDPDEDANLDNNGEPTDATKLKVTFDIDGTQDVLAATTTVRTWATTNQANFADETAYNAAVAAKYSASSARKGLDPELSFTHKLTRLTFQGQAGDNESQTVYVRGIKVRPLKEINGTDSTWYSREDVELTIADINAPTEQPIVFKEVVTKDDDLTEKPNTQFVLKKRAAGDTDGNQNLVDLIDDTDVDLATNGSVSMAGTWNTTPATWKAIGESLILPPSESYEVEILLAQVNTTEETVNGTPTKQEKIEYKTLKTVVRPTVGTSTVHPAFEAAYTYNFRIIVYGLQRIDVVTTLQPWTSGDNIDVDTDN